MNIQYCNIFLKKNNNKTSCSNNKHNIYFAMIMYL